MKKGMGLKNLNQKNDGNYIKLDIPVNYLPFPGKMMLSEYEELVTYFVQKWRKDGHANYLHLEEASSGLQSLTKDL